MKRKTEKEVKKIIFTEPAYLYLSGAQRDKTNPDNNVAIPGDEAVEEMRDFSIENKL